MKLMPQIVFKYFKWKYIPGYFGELLNLPLCMNSSDRHFSGTKYLKNNVNIPPMYPCCLLLFFV